MPHLNRIVADSTDRVAWMRARSLGITATDAAKLSTEHSAQNAVHEKLNGSSFAGNAYTDHGTKREPHIASWVNREYGIEPNTKLFHANQEHHHLATPDGIGVSAQGNVTLAEIKTTTKTWRSIPRNYLRQVWWQQYVLGAERTLLVWEQHSDFVPTHAKPECRWIERDETEINTLIRRANQLLELMKTSNRSR